MTVHDIPYCDPLLIFERVQEKKWSLLLDSARFDAHYGRYAYIAIDPFQVLWAKDGQLWLDDAPIDAHHNPLDLLKTILHQMPESHHPELPPFQGGAAGAFAYDLHQYIEPISTHCTDEMLFPDIAVGLYDVVISFDKYQKKAWIISTGWPEKTPEKRLARASERLKTIKHLVVSALESEPKTSNYNSVHHACLSQQEEPPSLTQHTISSNFDALSYASAVNRVVDYILAGDIFEANISQCFKSTLPPEITPFSLYRRLRENNPAPFAAFMNLGDMYVISASPERFLQVTNGKVETRPIKGTRPRHANSAQDMQLANELKASEKDIAENVMIVDLLRNDLSRVCQDHSINVTQLCGLESYATVHHLVSVVTGELKKDEDAISLLKVAFPGGSITGAPKIRAMQIIAEIEPSKRGIYCGSMGFISFSGAMDTSIAIRTFTIKDDIVTFQAGGAIVVDSDPVQEYQETLTKSAALREALTRPA